MRLSVLTTGRQDYSIVRSLCLELVNDPQFELRLWVGGMHSDLTYGNIVDEMVRDGIPIAHRMDSNSWSGHHSIEQSYALAKWIESAWKEDHPEALLLVGDRYETISAAMTATLLQLPLVHLHGGEESEGSMDNAFRHAITKMSHLHFVTHEIHQARVIAMGEDPNAVHVVGAPGLDSARTMQRLSRQELASDLGIELKEPVIVVSFHPATWARNQEQEVIALVDALSRVSATYVVTLPNSDPGNEFIRAALCRFANQVHGVCVSALGPQRFYSMLAIADAMVGNSSAGIIEAASFELPVVNVGDRQKGRLRAKNVIDVDADYKSIRNGLLQVLRPDFRTGLQGMKNPYGEGFAAQKMRNILSAWEPPKPPIKRWHG